MWSKQVAPNGANICYGILSCYKQVAPTELMIDKFFKRLNCYKISNTFTRQIIKNNVSCFNELYHRGQMHVMRDARCRMQDGRC
ncbi:MAG: hypothetical protein A2Z58_00135 [Planctomycetes bacterium RIFCSPHIGHO2_12_42_15]|nr:MAG: hypothetical protein A2Z58_00135 [Planctomycetes bacterium RIFCSPHIGHO2_12_42_15]